VGITWRRIHIIIITRISIRGTELTSRNQMNYDNEGREIISSSGLPTTTNQKSSGLRSKKETLESRKIYFSKLILRFGCKSLQNLTMLNASRLLCCITTTKSSSWASSPQSDNHINPYLHNHSIKHQILYGHQYSSSLEIDSFIPSYNKIVVIRVYMTFMDKYEFSWRNIPELFSFRTQ